jgi:integrase
VNIAQMCMDFIREQRAMLAANDPASLAPRTIADYANDLERRIIPAFGSWPPASFKPTHAAQYLYKAKQEKRAVRGNREIAALGAAFNHGMALGLVESNPCHGVRRNRERPRGRDVSIAELNRLLDMAKEKGGSTYMVALIAVMVALTGRRRAEIRPLCVDQLTGEGVVANDAKTRRGQPARTYLIAWSPLLRQVVEEASRIRPKRSEHLFATRTGKPYTDSGFKTIWGRLMTEYQAKFGERFRAHDLRSLYVGKMLDRGEQPNTHQNPETMHRVYDRRRVIHVKPLA